MKITNGLYVLNRLKVLKNYSKILSGLIFSYWVIIPVIVYAGGIAFKPNWEQGDTWRVQAVYRLPDGQWSSAKRWMFTVVKADNAGMTLRIRNEDDTAGADLLLEKNSGQVTGIALSNSLRGNNVFNEIILAQKSPVYPLYSPAPFYLPVFLEEGGDRVYELKPYLNNHPIPIEKLTQNLYLTTRQELQSAGDNAVLKGWNESLSGISETGYRITVVKGNMQLFEQYWFPNLPWAVYTASETCKVWLEIYGLKPD